MPADLHGWGHEGVLAQVLANLVSNAVRSVDDHRSDGHVAVRAETAADRVRLVLEDNGIGMDAEVLRRAFEPFFTTKPFGSGTGRGDARDRRARPRSAAPGDATAPGPPGAAAVGADPRHRRRGRRPVVAAAAARAALRRGGRLRVEDGLARLDAATFDLVVCDGMMPGGGGERLYQTLLGRDPGTARRVVFLTGGAVTDAARQFLRGQPQPVPVKPVELEQLARVSEQLRGGGAGPLTH